MDVSSAASPISTMSLARLLHLTSQSSLVGPSSYSIAYLPLRIHLHGIKLYPSPHPWRSTFTSCSSSGTSSSAPMDEGGNGEFDAEERALREGVSEILEEAGVSKSDCLQIVSNSTKYAKMLREEVRDLDELSLWSSWMREKAEDDNMESGTATMSLKEKVKHIAKEKGDYGKIPYLESIGLSLSSSIHLAPPLSSESLPSLINKVNYVKEIFFSGCEDEMLAGKLARRMMFHLSVFVDEDVQQTLSFFEKIEARRGGLDMLGSADASFRHLIESFPRLLLLSLESNMKPVVKFLVDIGVPRQRLGIVLLLFPPLLFLDVQSIRAGLQRFEEVGASDKDVARILMKYPWVISRSTWRHYKDILAFLDAERVPKASINRTVRDWPLLLGCSTDKLKVMVEHLDELGVRTERLGKVIRTSPQLLLCKPEEFDKVVSFWRDLQFDKESIIQILVRCPEIFASSTKNTLKKKVEFLTKLGIPEEQLPRVVKKYPEFLVSDVDRTVMPRLRYLMKAGLSERDIASMVTRFSPLLGYSIEEVLQPKLDFLLNAMGKRVKEVVDYPRYFSYSLEKKIKPRFFMLRGRNINCSLKDMLAKNDDEFATEYLGIERMFASIR